MLLKRVDFEFSILYRYVKRVAARTLCGAYTLQFKADQSHGIQHYWRLKLGIHSRSLCVRCLHVTHWGKTLRQAGVTVRGTDPFKYIPSSCTVHVCSTFNGVRFPELPQSICWDIYECCIGIGVILKGLEYDPVPVCLPWRQARLEVACRKRWPSRWLLTPCVLIRQLFHI